ncbi:MAG: type I restriction-modification system subunit M [Muribaculaceae bacterium]
MPVQSEAALENGLIDTLQKMNYEYVHIEEEKNLSVNFKKQLEKHNKKKLEELGRTEFTDSEFEKILIYLEGGTRFEKAKKLRDLFPLELESGERLWVEFLNRTHWCQNEFQVSNQITVEGRKKCRYDVTILINGLPLVQIELKRRGVELKQAYNQIQRYHKTSFHGLFDYIQLFVISNGVNTRYFANNPNSGYKFTFNWTDAANVPFNDLEKFATVFFDKCTLGKIIGKYIVLHEGDKCLMVLRPYQFYAVEKILDRVENSNDNGYIWHTTGAGKTLTSFKAAQLVSELDDVDKVMFVVDRHDLDTQTQAEYEAFEPGAVDSTDNTDELVKRLHSNSKIIITTIQKLNAAVSKQWYSSRIEEIRHSRIVMIFDECHRSHFGECHKNIVKFFDNTQIFGFTGTPIFVENAVDGHTTKEIFGNCLHKYLIKDAIADENVLGFLVEYYHGNEDVDNADQDRMTEIAKFILNNFNKSTFDGEFDALFAVQSVPMLIRYYKIFKSLNPKIRIGAVFTYAANSSQDDEQTGMNTGGYVSDSTGEADELQAIMDDYNNMYGTSFTTENFRAYYDDINLRMKKKKHANDALVDDEVTFKELWAMEKDEDIEELQEVVKTECLENIGYFIEPNFLFSSVIESIKKKENILPMLERSLKRIEDSTLGQDSEEDFGGLFSDIDLASPKLGKTADDKNTLVSNVLLALDDIDFGVEASQEIDILGDAYEYMISQFAAGAGKKAGEFYTPQEVSRILAEIVTIGHARLRNVYDPTCGSGSLLLRAASIGHANEIFGQEKNPTTYNLARMNMLLHGIKFSNFRIENGDTLEADAFGDTQFDAVVANPPFSAEWSAADKFNNDDRFSKAGRLAPRKTADYAFILHMIYHLNEGGTMACVAPHGVLFRGYAEGVIRRFLIEKKNYVDAIIGLPANIFYGTSIPTCILVFKKCRKEDDNILFIDASKEFEKVKTQNKLRPQHIKKIVDTYCERKEIEKYSHLATLQEVAENDYNLNIPRYVDTFEEEEPIDIHAVMKEIKELEAKRADLDKEIEGYLKELGLVE